jgi:hypothetical protein
MRIGVVQRFRLADEPSGGAFDEVDLTLLKQAKNFALRDYVRRSREIHRTDGVAARGAPRLREGVRPQWTKS